MSVPKLISPLLDGFVMGDAISDHHGVRCCPAMRMSDSGKYIVKIISVPTSQTKLDALLLAGAFSDRAAAMEYYRELSQDLVEEAALLERCSRLEGFVAYESWQVEPMEDGCGFDVYLLAPYRTTLDRLWQREPLTHLQAVNLGLDLCSALASCRRSGWLYGDLKPENICICPNGEYRIGDIGFLSLSSLPYTSLPERHHSCYTAPEVTDAYSALNATMDTYALGLILYQIFNGGVLPEAAPGQTLRAPEYADTQMAQILLKACAPDPAERWEDPVQMGQALVNYLQSHTVNDTPIIPQPEPEPEEEEEPISDELSTDAVLAAVDQALENATVFPEEPEAEETEPAESEAEDATAEADAEEPAVSETEDKEAVTVEPEAVEVPTSEDAVPEEDVTEDPVTETAEEAEAEPKETAAEEPITGETVTEEAEEETEAAETHAEDVTEETDPQPEAEEKDAAPEEGSNGWTDALVSEEFAPVMEQADDLIAHELPAPVVVPEHIELPDPVLPVEEEPPEAETAEPEEEAVEAPEEPEEPEAEEEEDPDLEAAEDLPAPPAKKRKLGCFVGALITLLLLALLATAGYVYYNHYYLQSVQELHLTGSEDQLTVRLDTAIDNALLTVYCTDPYGNAQRLPVIGNTVTFTGLRPRTRYKIHVEIDGFHKLIGVTSDTYITDEQTVLSGFTAVAGDTDGSAILSFTVQGPEAPEWKLLFSCPGESERQLTFTGHMVNVTGLTPGNTYTFRIEPAEPLYVVGDTTLEYTATRLVYAHLLSIQSFAGGKLTAVWLPPEGVTVNSWTVRCAGTNGAAKTIVVTEPIAVFEGLDPADAYTVQVTAEGMTVSATAFITANSVTIDSVTVDDSVPGQITLNWTYQGTTPKDGWLVLYNASGYPEAMVIRSDEASATISPVIPGMLFEFTIQSAEGSTVFGGHATYQAPTNEPFAGFMVTAENFTFQMCRTPAKEAWTQADVPAKDYVDTFAPGEKASFVITLDCVYGISEEEVRTLAVIWDEYGIVVDTITVNRSWSSMWYKNFGKLDLFELPETPGFYTIEVYFNEAIVTNQSFIIAVPEA